MRESLMRWYHSADLNFTKLILSPEHQVDLKQFTRDTMTALERDHGTRLEWLAVVHTNTDQPHVHVVLRHKDFAGREVQLSHEYLHHTLHTRAREEMTRMIGYRDPGDRLRPNERCQQQSINREPISRAQSREQHATRAYASPRI
jgi:type IV secretory pathway VirD2 relaxase